LKYYLFILLLLFSCDNPLINTENKNCIIELDGFYDDCNVCSGGTTGHIPNSDKDCSDVCFGSSTLDGCGICDDSIDNNCNLDCNGVENGQAFWDDCNNCVGGNTNLIANNLMDDCGVCFDSDSNYDQYANTSKDLCGVCNGNNTSCNIGLLTLQNWNFSKIELWNNSDCYGIPSYIINDIICLENNNNCFSYSLDFSINQLIGSLDFTQTINFNDGSSEVLSGQWSINNQGICLDYILEQYQDECYDIINFENDFFDCENDISSCNNNSVYFTSKNNDTNQCSKESYDFLNTETILNEDILSNLYNFSPAIIKNTIITATK
tara:strand:- start:11815 stop:12780 length:966 start_codon:yes stop_codon:yes gene_type:complete